MKHAKVRFRGVYAKQAEKDEKEWGRETAIYNYAWLISCDQNYEKGYHNGFFRACELIMGANKAKWKPADRALFNRVSRKLFGKKRK